MKTARAQKVLTPDHWKVVEKKVAGDATVFFLIRATESVETPSGSSFPQMGVSCETGSGAMAVQGSPATFILGKNPAIEGGDVKVAFDDSAPVSQNWDDDPPAHKALSVPEELGPGFILRLTNAKKFILEITPAGGKPQRAEFKVLNLKELMSLEAKCKPLLAAAQNSGSGSFDPWTRAHAGQRWHVHHFPIDDQDLVTLTLTAKNTIHVLGVDGTANLSVTCGISSLVNVTVPAIEDTNVRIAFDDEPPVRDKWLNQEKALGPLAVTARQRLLGRLLGAKTFTFEYTPRGGTPQTSTFDLLDLNDIVNHEKSCRSWLHPQF